MFRRPASNISTVYCTVNLPPAKQVSQATSLYGRLFKSHKRTGDVLRENSDLNRNWAYERFDVYQGDKV